MIIPSLNVSFNTILSTDIYVALEQELCLPSRSEYIRLITIILAHTLPTSGGTLLWDNRRLIGRSLIVLARKVQNNRD